MNNYTFTEGEKVVIKVQFNTADNAQILARLRYAGATAENFETYVNYNKIYNNINSKYITNQGYGEGNLVMHLITIMIKLHLIVSLKV